MKIKKKGFVCQVAYFWGKDFQIPDQTNLCSLFWRFVLNIIPVGIMFTVIFSIAGVILSMASVFGFLFAKRPGEVRSTTPDGWGMVDYKRWPTIKGRRIYPIWILAFALGWLIRDPILLSLRWIFACLSSSEFWMPVGLIFGVIVAIILLVIVVVFLRLGFEKVLASETGQLCLGMIKAKKEKFCPIVEIVDASDVDEVAKA